MNINACTFCGKSKSDKNKFYIDRSKDDSLTTYCKSCSSKMAAKRYKRNREKIRRKSTEYRWNNINKVRERDRNRDRKESDRKYRKNNRKKHNAHIAVSRSIERGELPKINTQKCNECGHIAENYHHPSYDEPLIVISLCFQCHMNLHKRIRDEKEIYYPIT